MSPNSQHDDNNLELNGPWGKLVPVALLSSPCALYCYTSVHPYRKLFGAETGTKLSGFGLVQVIDLELGLVSGI